MCLKRAQRSRRDSRSAARHLATTPGRAAWLGIVGRLGIAAWMGIAGCLGIVGCQPGGTDSADRGTDDPGIAATAVSRTTPALASLRGDLTARQWMLWIDRRYRTATSYGDHGVSVVQVCDANGKVLETATAPMSVWLRDDEIYIRHYHGRLWSDGDHLIGHIIDPETNHLDRQVLSVPVNDGRPRDEMWKTDLVLRDVLIGGALGAGPQLGLLFDTDRSLLNGETVEFEFTGYRDIDGIRCRAVRWGKTNTTFWIDPMAGLIRRVDYPFMKDGDREVRRWVEFRDASFDPPAQIKRDILPADPRWVRELIPTPPPPVDPRVGTRIDRWRVDSTIAASLLVRDSAERLDALVAGSAGRKRRPDEWARIDFDRDGGTHAQWIDGRDLRIDGRDLRIDGRDRSRSSNPSSAWLIDDVGEIHFVQSLDESADLATLFAAAGDLVQGVDVADRNRGQRRELRRQYRERLAEVTINR